MNIQEIIDKNLKECFEIHNEKISDKYRPYLTKIAQEIHNNALDLAIENSKVYLKQANSEYEDKILKEHNTGYGWITVDKQSIEQLKIKI
jgi:hypothetical protein